MSAGACVPTDFGNFTMCVPEDWRLSRAGTDSNAGMFSGDGIRVSFDFGLYSDPLTLPEQATQVKEFSKAVGGHLAHHVSYSRGSINAVGIHFPKVSSTSIGPLKLTVLAQSRDMTKLRAVDEAFATIKFK